MFKYVLLFSLAFPLHGYCQSYADTPFYKPVSAIPSTAHVEAYAPGSIKANDIVIDLSVSEIGGSITQARVDGEIPGTTAQARADGTRPPQIFHFYIQYNNLKVVFGYDLLAEPVEGTDEIRCTFKALSDSEIAWHHDKEIAPVAFPAELTPVVIKSGDALAIKTLPLGEGKVAVVHYLRLTRMDLTADSSK